MLRRIFNIIVVYLCSCLLAGLLISIASTQWLFSPGPTDFNWAVLALIGQFAVFYAGVTFALSALPAGFAIYFAETKGIRRTAWYVIAGAVAGGIGTLCHLAILVVGASGPIMAVLKSSSFLRLFAFELITMPASGACAGFLFWLLAIRPGPIRPI